jgi:hypothetical protein
MLDIGVRNDGTLLVYTRRIVTEPDRASRIAAEMVSQMERIVEDLRAIGAGESRRSESREIL